MKDANLRSFGEYVLKQSIDVNANAPQLIEGQNKNTGVRIALKYFSPNLYSEMQKKFKQQQISRSLVMFAELKHRNLIHYHETISNEKGVFIVMDWCILRSFHNLREDFAGKEISEKLLVKYVFDVLNGLEFLHHQGVAHSNLRASNILLTDKESKLTDFGFSALYSNSTIESHPYWFAPETLTTNNFTKESDIWSLGCTIIEMLTGKPPWSDLDPEQAMNKIKSKEIPQFPDNISSHLTDFLCTCFEIDPGKRHSIAYLKELLWITTNISIPSTKITIANEPPRSTSSLVIVQRRASNEINLAAIDQIFDDDDSDNEEVTVAKEKEANTTEEATINNQAKKTSLTQSAKIISQNQNSSDSESDSAFETPLELNGGTATQPVLRIVASNPRLMKIPTFDDLDTELTDEEKLIFAKKERLHQLTNQVVIALRSLTEDLDEKTFSERFDTISKTIKEEPDVRHSLVSQQCVLPIIEILVFSWRSLSPPLKLHLLQIIYDVCKGQKDIKENFCLLGGLPPILELLSHDNSIEIRSLALSIIIEICNESLDLSQLMIACNGVSALVEILEYDVHTEMKNVASAIKLTYDIFKELKDSQKVNFARIFMHEKAYLPLQVILYKIAKPDDDITDQICQLDFTFANADEKARSALSEPEIMKNIVKTIYDHNEVQRRLSMDNLLLLLKCIKMVAAEPENRENLYNSGVMEMTCELLKIELTPDEILRLHIHANLILLLSHMCNLSNQRTCFVAQSRLLPYMKEYLQNESTLKLTALAIIMPLYVSVNHIPGILDTLIEDGLIQLYLDNLSTPIWCVKAISALQHLLEKRYPQFIKILLTESSLQKIREGIRNVNNEDATAITQKLTSMIRKSSEFTNRLINNDFKDVVIAKLNSTNSPRKGALVNAIFELLLSIYQSNAPNAHYLKNDEMKNLITPFITSKNVKHQILATQLIQFFR